MSWDIRNEDDEDLEFLGERIPFYNSFQKKSGFTVPIDQWIPEMSKNLSDILPKLECLTYIIPSSLIKDLCLSLQYNKNSVIPVWRLIFFALWYFYNVDKKKIEGNTFDILNENLFSMAWLDNLLYFL